MESANFHHQQYHHQLQDQLAGSSPLPTSSCYGVLGSSTHAWTPNTILYHKVPPTSFSLAVINTNTRNLRNFSSNSSGFIVNNSRQQYEYFLIPSLNSSSMTQDLGFQWASNSQSAHDLHLSRIKGELSDSYKKLTDEMIHSSPSRVEDLHLQPTSYIKNVEQRDLNDQSHEKLFLRNFSSGCQINGLEIQAGGFSGLASVHTPCRGSFSRIYPTINISNSNHSSSFDMDLQALDLFTSGRFSGSLRGQDSHDNLCLYKDTLSYGIDLTQQSIPRPSNSSTKKISAFTNGVTEAKRHSNFLDPKVPQAAQKKSRSDSRPSSAPFKVNKDYSQTPHNPRKVRKEKLGDRIASLQQLVAPFGKTDTASVLMEAIGYIKFLQNQVETLSVPYMKSSRSNNCRTMKGVSVEDGNEDARGDLGSRGLCLVPLSCLSYVTDGGGGVWLPANFNTHDST